MPAELTMETMEVEVPPVVAATCTTKASRPTVSASA